MRIEQDSSNLILVENHRTRLRRLVTAMADYRTRRWSLLLETCRSNM